MIATIESIYMVRPTLTKILKLLENEREISIKDSHALARNLRIIESECELIDQSKNKIIEKYSESNNIIPPKNMSDYMQELGNLLTTKIDISLMTLNFSIFKYIKKLSPLDISSLRFLIVDFDENLFENRKVSCAFGQIKGSKIFFDNIVFQDFDFETSLKFYQIISETDQYHVVIEQHRINLIDSILGELPKLDEQTSEEDKQLISEKRLQFNDEFTKYLSQEIKINIPLISFSEFEKLGVPITPIEFFNLDYIIEQ